METIYAEDIVWVEYYDMKGNCVVTPGEGIYVRKYNLKDGKTLKRPFIRR